MTAMSSSEIFLAIENIASKPGKNDKIDLLKTHMIKGDFSRVIGWALDPFITYGIRPNRHLGIPGLAEFDHDTYGLLQRLSQRSLTGDQAKQEVAEELATLNPSSSELLWRIINKDLKAGFSEASVNKACKGFFKEFPYMRCSLPKDTDFDQWRWSAGVVSQVKADGMFVNVNIDGFYVTMTTRQGNAIPEAGFENIHLELGNIPEWQGTQTHGEIIVIAPSGKECSREIGNGMINKVIGGGTWEHGFNPVIKVWDQIPLSEVKPKNRYKVEYRSRLTNIKNGIESTNPRLISLIESRIVYSLKEAYKHYAECLALGLEGTVVKKMEMIWGDYTSKDQIKLKLEAPCELEVVGFEDGKEGAKTAATFGSLILRSSDGLLQVNCSGFTDALRLEIHNNREDWLGSIVTCISNGIMYSIDPGKKPHSLFLPRFSELRLDKTEADSFTRIEWQFENAISKIEAEAMK